MFAERIEQFENAEFVENKYIVEQELGAGTYGIVYKAIRADRELTATTDAVNKAYAIKKFLVPNIGEITMSVRREINILQKLVHSTVVKLIEIGRTEESQNGNLYFCRYCLILELGKADLATMMDTVNFEVSSKKAVLKQILQGLVYIHHSNEVQVLHRDLKPGNILVSNEGIIKLADFGLARITGQTEDQDLFSYYVDKEGNQLLTDKLGTLWYMAPEVLLEAKMYGPQVDIWPVGCILYELWNTRLKRRIFEGLNVLSHLECISKLLGRISEKVWPGVERLPLYNEYKQRMDVKDPPQSGTGLRDEEEPKDETTRDLLKKLLTLNPNERVDSLEALDHPFFKQEPLALPHLREIVTQYDQIIESRNFRMSQARQDSAEKEGLPKTPDLRPEPKKRKM